MNAMWNPVLREPNRGITFSSSDLATSSLMRSTRRPGEPIFNRSVPLRDSWAKIQKKGNA